MVLGTKYNQPLLTQKLRIKLSNINASLESKIACISRAMKRKMLVLTARVFETIENEFNSICYQTPVQLSHRRL